MPGRFTVRNLSTFRAMLRTADIGVSALLLPTALAFMASIAEGLSLALLIPTLDAIVYGKSPALSGPVCSVFQCTGDQPLQVWLLVVAIFFAAILKTSLAYFSSVAVANQIGKFAAALRIHIYERYLSYGKLFFDRNNSGTLHQVVTTYVSMISRSLNAVNSAFYSGATLVVYLAILLTISWQLTALVMICFPLLHASLRTLIRKIAVTSTAHAEIYNQIGKSLSNSLGGITLVQGYNAQRGEIERFAHMSRNLAALELSVEKKSLLVAPVQELILLGVLFGLLAAMSWMGHHGAENPVTSFAVYLLVLRRAIALFGVFNSIHTSFAAVAGPVNEVSRVLSNEGKHKVPEGHIHFGGIQRSIECRNLTFEYSPGAAVLDGLTAEFRRGEVTAIVGTSGSGKTTLVNLLMRFYDVEPGHIFVDGVDLRDLTLSSWRSRIALVGQDAFLFDATLRENLLYGLGREVTEADLLQAVEQSGLAEYVSELPAGLRTVVGDRGVQLSGGERQRVAIARAILRNAEILLLDEPTSALDSTTERLIQDALDELVRDRTTIVVAHRLSTIRNADNILVFERGKVIERGTFDELCDSGERFSQFWSHQTT